MKELRWLWRRLWGSIMGHYVFEGRNVVLDLKHEDAVFAVICGDVIEIRKTDGTTELIPKSPKNIGQLVGYCYVIERKTVEMEVVEAEIEESCLQTERREKWRRSKGLNLISSSKFDK